MLDIEADYRGKAEACRQLSDLADDPDRMWIRSAGNREWLAAKAPKQKELEAAGVGGLFSSSQRASVGGKRHIQVRAEIERIENAG